MLESRGEQNLALETFRRDFGGQLGSEDLDDDTRAMPPPPISLSMV
jgi:hypothetical protein